MAKHAQTKNKTFSPQEELRVKEQELADGAKTPAAGKADHGM